MWEYLPAKPVRKKGKVKLSQPCKGWGKSCLGHGDKPVHQQIDSSPRGLSWWLLLLKIGTGLMYCSVGLYSILCKHYYTTLYFNALHCIELYHTTQHNIKLITTQQYRALNRQEGRKVLVTFATADWCDTHMLTFHPATPCTLYSTQQYSTLQYSAF